MMLIPILDTKEHKIIIHNVNSNSITCDVLMTDKTGNKIYFTGWIWAPPFGYSEINLSNELIQDSNNSEIFLKLSQENNILLEEFLYFDFTKNKKTINLEGFEVTVFLNDLISCNIIKTNKFWEVDLFERFLPYLQDIKDIIDCGANLGSHSLMFHKYFPKSQIYSFEPSSTNYELLLSNTKKIDHIHTFKTALSSTRGTLRMEIPFSWNRGSTTVTVSKSGELVQSSLLDDFALENISFIKIDVEGHELELIKGSLNTIINNRPIIWLEDFTGDTKTFLETRLGYRTISFDEHSNYLLSSN